MARRTGSGLLDAGVELPWWVSVVLAGVVYISLSWLFPWLADANGLAAAVGASAGFFALPFLVLAGFSGTLAYRRRRRLDLETSLATIRALPQQRFEQFVAEALHAQGYAVSQAANAAASGGADLVLSRGDEKVLVQCRRWRSAIIDSAAVRALYAAMLAEHATACMILATGDGERDALAFAAGKPIRLITGHGLEKMLRAASRPLDASQAAHAHQTF